MSEIPPDARLLSPAKINLFLHVTGRRPDGYHLLQTWMQFLDWGDRMLFRANRKGMIRRHDEHPYTLPAADLSIRAAEVLRQAAGRPELGADITLEKRVPPGTGLGGGSSNAATTLLVLNRLWQLHLSAAQLRDLGRGLGADVPVFLHGASAWAEGTGDLLTTMCPPAGWVAVALPGVAVSTESIFSDPGLRRDHPPVSVRDYTAGLTGNDLEVVTFQRHPEVAAAHRCLSRFGPARMSGTGSAVFVPLPTREAAEQVIGQLPDGMTGLAARRLNRSPLQDWMPEPES